MGCLVCFKRNEERQRHAHYLAACLRDCLERNETPYASHALLTLPGVLHDDVPEERERGIAAGFAMRRGMDATVIYVDLGWSSGMHAGLKDAAALGLELISAGGERRHLVEERTLGPNWDKR